MNKDSILLRIIRAAQVVDNRIDTVLADVELSRAKLAVLHHLADAAEPISLTKLASMQCCVKSNITNLIDRMESEGLVERLSDDHDRRSVRVRVTRDGRRIYNNGKEIVEKEERQLLKKFNFSDREHLGELLARFEQSGVGNE
jgi:DNA-binding MarR family transcriptional regulator